MGINFKKINKKWLWIAIFMIAAILALFLAAKPRMKEISIDGTSDIRALGYSGQRKIFSRDENFYVTYRKKRGDNFEIFLSQVFASGNNLNAFEPKPVSSVGNNQRVPSIAGDNDNVYVIWYGADKDGEEDERQIKYASFENQVATKEWKNISVVEGFEGGDYWQEHPFILRGEKNDLYVVWEGRDFENDKQQIKFSRSEDLGRTWSGWKNVLVTPDKTQSRPVLLQDFSGKLHLFMYSSFGDGSNTQKIQYSWSGDDGNSWSEWRIISAPGEDSRHISAAVDGDGNIHVVWRSVRDKDGKSQIVYRFSSKGEWGEIRKLPFSGKNQFFPSLGILSGNLACVVWMESDKKSGLPQENPKNGEIFLSIYSVSGFKKPVAIADDGIYPNLPEKIENKNIVPVLYLKPNENDNRVILKLLNF